jgi:hypothetical protein
MSISSTGLYGSATIVNSDLFQDVTDQKEQVTTLSTSYLTTTKQHRDDISQNRLDISSNLSKITDINYNRITAIEDDITDISNNRITVIEDDITDISNKRITAIEDDITDLSDNRITSIEQHITDISNNRITSIEQDITEISNNRMTSIELRMYVCTTDISSNKDFIRHLQSVDYSILLANAPAQWPTPPIKSGYNGVFCADSGVDIVAQNFLPSNIGTPSVLSIRTYMLRPN